MPQTDNPALKFELLQSDDYSQFLLTNPAEIQHVMRDLIRKRAMITAYMGSQKTFMLTSVLALSDGDTQLVLDVPPDESIRAQALDSEELICVTQIASVKIQFPLSGLRKSTYDDRPAMVAPLPQRLLRLQRREYFRLTAPVAHSLLCQIPVTTEAGATTTFEARVIDISGGGIAIVVPPEGVEFKPNTEFTNCQIALPETGTVRAGLRIRSVFRVTNRQGVSMLRAGCEFIDLPERIASVIHRYILKVERDRNARDR
ncbi:MAG: flagellar brake protein [Rhodocyclaceae bacterium]|nr:flagellar brake protein [Rhodocyclaceae bacterium]